MDGTMNWQGAVEAEEVAELETLWGIAPKRHYRLVVDHPFLTGDNQMLVSNGRRAEICYIMHRGTPAAGVLLHIKTFYPPGAYRLPTGGIHQGERVWQTLGREIHEETGLLVGEHAEHVQVQRFLGIASYDFVHSSLEQTFPFATYHFLVQMPATATLNPQDAEEQIGGWEWQPTHALYNTADYLEQVGKIAPQWGDWGRYRALSHRFVADALTK